MKVSALEGDLSEFQLTDIIQLVDLSKKTGGVHIKGKRGMQQIEGWLYFRDGKIVGADIPGLTPIESAYTFFTFSSGPFRLYDDVILDQPTITVSNEVIIMEGIMRQDAWEAIQEKVPSLQMIPRLVPNPSKGTTDINLEAEEWRVLTMINGKNTISQIAQRSGIGEFRACEIIAQLLSNGLIEERAANPAEKLAPEIEYLLRAHVHDNAEAIMQDSFARAGILDLPIATSEQLMTAIEYIEQAITRVLTPEQAQDITNQMRNRTRDILGGS